MSTGGRPPSKFRRLAATHAAMMGGEATMVVALADSFFFDVDPNAARSRVLLFLVVSFTPFLLVAPLIGPVIDGLRGGRRLVVQGVAAARIVVQLLMIAYSDQWALFPLVFVALVLQKTYTVSKAALVPSVVRSERELVEANSKLGLIAGLTGVVAVIPAAGLQVLFGTGATLGYGVVLFVLALGAATRLPRDQFGTATTPVRPGRLPPVPHDLRAAATSMLILRCCVGFVLFHLAFWFRTQDAGTFWFGLAVAASSVATMVGNAMGPRIRARVAEERMIVAALVLPAVAGLSAAVLDGEIEAVVLAAVLGFAAAIARLGFDSLVQRDAPGADRGRLFARFETLFQLGWVGGATVPVVLEVPGWLGFAAVGVASAVGAMRYRRLARVHDAPRHGRPLSSR